MSFVLLEKKDHIAIITVSREKALNALNTQVLLDLEAVVDEVEQDKDIYCAVVTGAGPKAFVAGADIAAMLEMSVGEAKEFSALGNRVFRKIETLRVPAIAAVNGFALGGGLELAMACDFRIASENAVLGLPETSLGIMPGYGGTQRLARLIGPAKAKKLMYTAGKMKAAEAKECGLVEEVVAPEELMDCVLKIAGKIAANAPLGVQAAKLSCNTGMQMDMSSAVALEAQIFGSLFATEDQKLGMGAFVNKEKVEKFSNK